MQSARLVDTDLRGVPLDEAKLDGALLKRVNVWRADIRGAIATDSMVIEPNFERQPRFKPTFPELKMLIEQTVPGGPRDEALERVQILDPGRSKYGSEFERLGIEEMAEAEAKMAVAWSNLARNSSSSDRFEALLANRMLEIGCHPEGAPYVLHGMIQYLAYKFDEPSRLSEVAGAFLNEAKCPGAWGLSEEDKATLANLRDYPTPEGGGKDR
jgi:hypothetical protein